MPRFEVPVIPNTVVGSFLNPYVTGIDRPGSDLMFSRNQHGQFFSRRSTTRFTRTPIQAANRNRFRQLECMWRAMTPDQRRRMRDFNDLLNAQDKRNLQPLQRFRALGLKSELFRFPTAKLYPSYSLELLFQDRQTQVWKATLDTKKITEFEPIFWRRLG